MKSYAVKQPRLPAVGHAAALKLGQGVVALFNVAGELYAIDDTCLRCGGSLASGQVRGCEVQCAECQWRYELATGSVGGLAELQIDTFEVVADAEGARVGCTPRRVLRRG